MEFIPFPKIGRLSRNIIITEKLDGTNACVRIESIFKEDDPDLVKIITSNHRGRVGVFAQSRSRFIKPGSDNYGFAAYVNEHAEGLVEFLGEGTHFGEWWGQGIQRGYNLKEKRFSLFNTSRWNGISESPAPLHVVPVLHSGPFREDQIEYAMERLRKEGSIAAPGFNNPEGVVIYHPPTNTLFKKTLVNDELPKGVVEKTA